MKTLGLFRDQEKAGFFIGFIAGVLGTNRREAQALIVDMFPLPAKEQAVIVKAVAYSGHPDWQDVLRRFARRMPERKPMIDGYLSGAEPTLMYVPLESGASVIYTLWGYYVATGHYAPVLRIISALRWCKSKDTGKWYSMARIRAALTWSGERPGLDKMNVASTAKWTLASYAERDRDLLVLYRAELGHRSEQVAAHLEEVIAAAESFEAERIRKEEHAVLEEERRDELKRKAEGSGAATAGSVAIATTCVVATATGHPEIGVPCVIAGALYGGALKLFRSSR